ncbi:MAG: signal peptidase I [Acidobacteria bacterium]|nr:MAG: signal peptidase I [Acidobacteriota bacterium]
MAHGVGRLIFGENPRRTTVRILILAAVSVVTFGWILIPVRAEGISMMPTYRNGSLNLVNRLAFLVKSPERGDIVAIRLAGPHAVYIKRIVGLPGERIAIADGTVRINGRSLDEPYVRNRSGWTMAEVQLGSDEYFLIGDNRGMREEEHDFGRAHRSRIVGKVVF